MHEDPSPPCACGSGAAYVDCCARWHAGAEPPDPETLVRARFCAFARGEHAFVHRTLHSEHDDRAHGERAYVAMLEKHGRRARYRALRILDRDGPDADGVARVLFWVSLSIAGQDASFLELSSFARDRDGWRYLCGRSARRRTLREDERPTIAELERETAAGR